MSKTSLHFTGFVGKIKRENRKTRIQANKQTGEAGHWYGSANPSLFFFLDHLGWTRNLGKVAELIWAFLLLFSGSLLGWVSPRWPAIGSFLSRPLTNGRAAGARVNDRCRSNRIFLFFCFMRSYPSPSEVCKRVGWTRRQTNSMSCQVSLFLFCLFYVLSVEDF